MKVDQDKLEKLCKMMLFDMEANLDRDNTIFGLMMRPYHFQLKQLLEDKNGS